jgi:hypothetical protein
MLNKTKIALVAALVAGSATAASAQGFDPNPANRYPAYAGANASAMYLGQTWGAGAGRVVTAPRLQTAPVALRQRQQQAAPQFQSAPVRLYQGGQQDGFAIDQSDRASSPYAGGVN